MEYWAKNQEEFKRLNAIVDKDVRPISELFPKTSKNTKKQKLKTSTEKYAEDVSHEYWQMITCSKISRNQSTIDCVLEFEDLESLEDLEYSSSAFYHEINLSPDEIKRYEDFSLINHIIEGKFIPILINLSRKKGDIISDVEHLLKTLDREAKVLKKSFKRPKHHWEEYDKYLKVFDLKTENPQMPWSEIAMAVFPEDVEERIAPHRREEEKKCLRERR